MNLFLKLASMEAGDFAHLNGSLEVHLQAVHNLLRDWGAQEPVCRAGLFHAAYGTAGFTFAMVSVNQRERISALIGEEAERCVYSYCACDRSAVWHQIGGSRAVEFRDRFTGGVLEMCEQELRDFCELTCANEVEIASSDTSFVFRDGMRLGGLFRRWSSYKNISAQKAVDDLWPPA